MLAHLIETNFGDSKSVKELLSPYLPQRIHLIKSLINAFENTEDTNNPAYKYLNSIYKEDESSDLSDGPIKQLPSFTAELPNEIAREATNQLLERFENANITLTDYKIYPDPDWVPPQPHKTGMVYQVDLPENDELLQWDSPLDQQPPAIQDLVFNIIEKYDVDNRINEEAHTGKDLYTLLAHMYKNEGASTIFQEDGIPGHRYLTGYARGGKGTQTYNFVIWDESRIKNVRKTAFQSGDGESRAYIHFLPNGASDVVFTERSDVSSIIHEFTHDIVESALRAMRDDKISPDFRSKLGDDLNTLAQYAGLESWQDWTDDAHETIAVAFERYVREGRSPTTALGRVFKRLAGFLKQIYQSVRQLGRPLNADVRDVFDRFVAGYEEGAVDGRKPKKPKGPNQPGDQVNQPVETGPAEPRPPNTGGRSQETPPDSPTSPGSRTRGAALPTPGEAEGDGGDTAATDRRNRPSDRPDGGSGGATAEPTESGGKPSDQDGGRVDDERTTRVAEQDTSNEEPISEEPTEEEAPTEESTTSAEPPRDKKKSQSAEAAQEESQEEPVTSEPKAPTQPQPTPDLVGSFSAEKARKVPGLEKGSYDEVKAVIQNPNSTPLQQDAALIIMAFYLARFESDPAARHDKAEEAYLAMREELNAPLLEDSTASKITRLQYAGKRDKEL